MVERKIKQKNKAREKSPILEEKQHEGIKLMVYGPS